MSDERDASKRDRDYDAFAVREGKDGKGYFHKIGAAFAHKDGEGFDIDMVAAPTNGRLTLRTPQERLEQTKSPKDHDDQDHWAYKNRGRGRNER